MVFEHLKYINFLKVNINFYVKNMFIFILELFMLAQVHQKIIIMCYRREK